ncbi:MAG: hypothetical protein MK175_20105 [Pseudoalteromonas sp.]|uniref:hypothetical protein n=1 Tax=Pseudoalteromonas sp. TaxID=53249 RepID=UPI0025F47F31|nr:hypothetical protein [Pseudoalteromonas sp.]MCH2089492.1 hypothetical protein [Pseudoalteromonas sp.]
MHKFDSFHVFLITLLFLTGCKTATEQEKLGIQSFQLLLENEETIINTNDSVFSMYLTLSATPANGFFTEFSLMTQKKEISIFDFECKASQYCFEKLDIFVTCFFDNKSLNCSNNMSNRISSIDFDTPTSAQVVAKQCYLLNKSNCTESIVNVLLR